MALLVVVWFVIELIVAALVADSIGILPMLLALAVCSALGAVVALAAGRDAFATVAAQVARGRMPGEELLDGAVVPPTRRKAFALGRIELSRILERYSLGGQCRHELFVPAAVLVLDERGDDVASVHGLVGQCAAERRVQLERQRSILDLVADDVKRLSPGLGSTDRAKLTEYLESVRDIERRITVAEEQSGRELPSFERPAGIPAVFSDHVKLMFDLQVLAWQTDMTRMTTFMMGREQNTRSYKELGYAEAYHALSHHQYDPAKILKVQQIDLLHVKCLAYFINKLRNTPDGDGTLLDHAMVVYGGALSDGNLHVHNNLPILLLGGGAGRAGVEKLHGGRHVRFPEDTPTTNLFLALLDRMGIALDNFGDSTGKLNLLSV